MPQRQRWRRGPRRRALALVFSAALFVLLVTAGILKLVIPRPPPARAEAPPPFGPALTAHVVFVVIDGLRYDIATDPSRMPHLARRMRERPSGEGLSGPVSMTSAAVLAFATGQRGDVEQIVRNQGGAPVAYHSLMQSVRAAGLVTAATGERAWFSLFPGAWSMARPDPQGVAIDVDYNAEIFEATRAFLASRPRPALLVAHFVTPDHQAHAYGVFSDRYRAHMLEFDRELEKLLRELPPDTTVIVTSDHGMTDTGSHGSSTPLQRRTPFVAHGPGIVGALDRSARDRAVDQIDVPGTIAALLGVSAPAHGRGHVRVDWLDIPDEERARIACADLARLRAYAAGALGQDAPPGLGEAAACGSPASARLSSPSSAPSARERIEGAARAAAEVDRALGQTMIAGLPLGWVVPLAAMVGALALGLAALGAEGIPRAIALRGVLLALLVVAGGVLLTYGVELLPGRSSHPVRVALYVIGHAILLAAALKPRAAAALLRRDPALGAALLPGILIVTPTKHTQAEAFVLAGLIAGFVFVFGVPSEDRSLDRPLLRAIREARSKLPLEWLRDPRILRPALALLCLVALLPAGLREAEYLPRWILTRPSALLALAASAALILGLERGVRARLRGELHAAPDAIIGAVIAVASLILRRAAPAPVCLAGWIGLPALAFIALRRGRRALAELLLFASYAWVSRDAELPILAAALLFAGLVGDALGEALLDRPRAPASVLLVVTFLFAWSFVERIGVQLGLDFVHLDWGAGAFRDEGVSPARVGAALAHKHAFARIALIYAVASALPAAHRAWALRGLFAAEIMRAATLALVLYVGRDSFWTSLRAVGELPHALLAVIALALAIVAAGEAQGGLA
jgi:hypothetical protein